MGCEPLAHWNVQSALPLRWQMECVLCVPDLHEYAREKIRKTSPVMGVEAHEPRDGNGGPVGCSRTPL
jgi:hypothetical protein